MNTIVTGPKMTKKTEKKEPEKNTFRKRLKDNMDELKWLYMELYHD